MSVNFSLQQLNVTRPSSCQLQYCFYIRSGQNCIRSGQCNITLPQPSVLQSTPSGSTTSEDVVHSRVIPQWINPKAIYSEPVYFQWTPINAESGNLIITYYNEKVR